MRKFITILILAVLMVTATSCTGYAKTDGFSYKQCKKGKAYVTKFYDGKAVVCKIKTKRKLKVYVVNSEDVYPQFIWERKNNFIVVEVIKGECLNGEGDGRTSDGYYISYRRVDGHEAGARYKTYCIYANNNYEDDIICRIDYRQ